MGYWVRQKECCLGQLGCWLLAGTVRMLSRTAGMLGVGKLGC